MRKRLKTHNDPIKNLTAIREGYKNENDGHRNRLIVLMVRGFREFQNIKNVPREVAAFYTEAGIKTAGRSKPPNLLKEVMAYIAGATTESARKLADKRARVLRYLDEKGVAVEKMPRKIKHYGGIEKTYRRATRKSLPTGLGKSRDLSPVPSIKARHFGKTPNSENEEPRRHIRNDADTNISVCVELSTLEKLRAAKRGDILALSARRVDEKGALLRIVGLRDDDDDGWTK